MGRENPEPASACAHKNRKGPKTIQPRGACSLARYTTKTRLVQDPNHESVRFLSWQKSELYFDGGSLSYSRGNWKFNLRNVLAEFVQMLQPPIPIPPEQMEAERKKMEAEMKKQQQLLQQQQRQQEQMLLKQQQQQQQQEIAAPAAVQPPSQNDHHSVNDGDTSNKGTNKHR